MEYSALGLALLMSLEDPALENVGSLEGHYTARRNRHFLTRLRISADALLLVAHLKGGE